MEVIRVHINNQELLHDSISDEYSRMWVCMARSAVPNPQWRRMCSDRWSERLKLRVHSWQRKGFTPVCFR